MKRIASLIVVLLFAAGAARGEPLRLPAMGDPADLYLSHAQERELGQQMMRQVRLRMPLLDDAEVNAYVRDLGQRLASHADAPGQSFQFFVVDHPAINAFAMPGGYIGVNSGLILAARSESELAGVMAHEIAHVTQRHIARGFAEAQRLNMRTTALILASIILATQDPHAGSAGITAGLAGSIQQQLNFSREHEHEADRVGVRILTAAGLDPMGMPRLFERLAQASQYRAQVPEWLSTHPLTEGRIADTYARANAAAGGKEVFESSGFGLMQARIRVLAARTPAEAVARFRAATADSDAPSARYGLALALARDGQFEEASALLEQLIRRHGEDASYLLALAQIDIRAGRLDSGLARFRNASSLYPHHGAIRVLHAQALLGADQPEQARQLLSRGLSQAGDDPQYYWLLARAASDAGRPLEAKLAMAEHYHLEGELESALTQLNQVMNDRQADSHQIARAAARAEQLRSELNQRVALP